MSKRESQIVKGIAIILMLFHHLFLRANLKRAVAFYSKMALSGFLINTEITYFWVKEAKICVSLFVFITGYGLVKKYKNKKPSNTWPVYSYILLVRDVTLTVCVALLVGKLLQAESITSVYEKSDVAKNVVMNCLCIASFLKIKWMNGSWWYITVAVCNLFLFPILYDVLKKYGPYSLLILSFFILPYLVRDKLNSDDFFQYLPCLVLGMIISEYELIEKLKHRVNKNKVTHIISVLVVAFMFIFSIYLHSKIEMAYLLRPFMATALVVLVSLVADHLRILSTILYHLGINSRFMWLIHVFIYSRWLHDALYSLHNIWLILLVLVVLSYLYSIVMNKVIDLFKKINTLKHNTST